MSLLFYIVCRGTGGNFIKKVKCSASCLLSQKKKKVARSFIHLDSFDENYIIYWETYP